MSATISIVIPTQRRPAGLAVALRSALAATCMRASAPAGAAERASSVARPGPEAGIASGGAAIGGEDIFSGLVSEAAGRCHHVQELFERAARNRRTKDT